MNKVLEDISVNLEKQYKGFRFLFWTDLVLAVLVTCFGNVIVGMILAILAIALASIANQKLVLINQSIFLNNQKLIMDKLEVKLVKEVPYV